MFPGGRLAPGDAARVAVRPEHVRIGAEESDGSRLGGTVANVVYLGMVTQFHVDTPAGRVVSHRLADDGRDLAEGDRVTLAWRPEHATVLADSDL